jgi:hypothetical protein
VIATSVAQPQRTNMLEWFKDFFRKKEEWRLVHTVDVPVAFVKVKRTEADIKGEGNIFFHLHESDRGARKCFIGCTIQSASDIKKNAESLEVYHKVVYPWIHGSYDPNIPSFKDVDLLAVQAKLSI